MGNCQKEEEVIPRVRKKAPVISRASEGIWVSRSRLSKFGLISFFKMFWALGHRCCAKTLPKKL